MSFLTPDTPKPKPAPTAPTRSGASTEALAEEQRRRLSARGPSTRAATLLGTASAPKSSDSFTVSRLLGGGGSI